MGKTLIDNSLAALTNRVTSCLDKEADCVSYLHSFIVDKERWCKCREMLISKFPNSNIAKTTRQSAYNYIKDCVSFFKNNTTDDKYTFVVSDFDLIPGLQIESIKLMSSTLSTIHSFNTTISSLKTNNKSIQKDNIQKESKSQSPPQTANINSSTISKPSNKGAKSKKSNTYSSMLKAPAPKAGTWTPSSNPPKAISTAKRLWLKTSSEVTTTDIKTWSSNWKMDEGSLDVKHIVKNTYTNSFFVSFKSKDNVYKDFIPTEVKYSPYINKKDPIEHDKRIPIKSLYLRQIGLDVKEATVKSSIHNSFTHADTSKTEVIFIDAKDNSKGKCDYKNAYVKIVGKEVNSTLAQSKSLPCKVFPWNYKLKIPTKSSSSPNNETNWSSFQPTDLNNNSSTNVTTKTNTSTHE